jgi:hypothetical protein
MVIMCTACTANPAEFSTFCVCCWRDQQAAEHVDRKAAELARVESRRRGRPAWRPEWTRSHGRGTGRHCGE